MLDLSFIGKNGFIIQYEDIISLIGYNVILTLKKQNLVQGMSDEDILLNYFNREINNPSEYIKQTYHIDFKIEDMYKSPKALRPNMYYAFKIFDAAYKNGITTLLVYSKRESNIIREYVNNQIPGIPIEYVYGDIVPILKEHYNATFLTSDVEEINKLSSSDVPPFALTIVDDFMYTAPVVNQEYVYTLRKKGIFVGFTGIISAGLVP